MSIRFQLQTVGKIVVVLVVFWSSANETSLSVPLVYVAKRWSVTI